MNALEVYAGSDATQTRQLYARLMTHGAVGVVAVNLFRAQKSSSRAKQYRGGIRGLGSYRELAYQRKSWSMKQLCSALTLHAEELGIKWGWKKDNGVLFMGKTSWVLYVDLPWGQVSFHSIERFSGPDYAGEWDKCRASAERIVAYCQDLLDKENQEQKQLQL